MKEVMPIEQAEAEVTAWLDKNKITPARRGRAETAIENLIEAVQYGTISIGDNGKITHTLAFPLTDVSLNTLTYKERENTESVMKAISGLKVNTADTQLIAHIAELTDQPYGYITKLHPTDLVVSKSIGVFFMS